MHENPQSLYAAHVAEVQARWEAALEAEQLQAVLVHSGTPLHSFLDDYEYAFRPNPHFLYWLPLTRHADSALLIVPGRRPRLFYYQPDDYWYLPPADPESWWADHFDIEVVRDAGGWRAGLAARRAGAPCGLDGVAVKEWEKNDDGAQRRWTVQLADRHIGRVRLAVDFQQQYDPLALARLGVPLIQAEEVEEVHLVVGDHNDIRENVTIHMGTGNGGGMTRVGSDNLLMVGAHVAHDCILGNHCILANNVTLAGHVDHQDPDHAVTRS